MGEDIGRTRVILRLHDEGLNSSQIAEIIGIDGQLVCYYLRQNKRGGRQYGYLTELSQWQTAVLYGSLVGDASLKAPARPHHNVQLKFGHCARQERYMMWKVDQLDQLFLSHEPNRYLASDGVSEKVHPAVEISSRSHPILTDLRRKFYPDGQRTISRQILNEIGNLDYRDLALAVWYMDNGSVQHDCARLAVGNMTDQVYEMVAEWFCHLGFSCRSDPTDSNCVVLGFRIDASESLFSAIGPYIHEDMSYKLGRFAGCVESQQIGGAQ